MDDLDNYIAEEIKDVTPTAEPVAEKEVVAQEPVKQADNSSQVNQDKTAKLSRREAERKSQDEYRSFADRKINELTKKIQDYDTKFKTYAPMEQFMPELQKVLAEKRKNEQAQQFQQNPIQAQQQLMEQMLNERLAPFQQQAQNAQIAQETDQNINWMKQTYGEEAFNEVSPYMKNILDNTTAQYGPEIANVLARSPEHLFNAAFGHLALQKIREFNQGKQAGTQNKQQLAQQSAGISRPNKTSRVQSSQSTSQIEQAAFDFLKQNA